MLHLQNLHTCIQRVQCTNNTFWHAKCPRTQVHAQLPVLHADLSILHMQLACLWLDGHFVGATFIPFLKISGLFADSNHLFIPFVLTTLLYFHPSLKNCNEFLDQQRGFFAPLLSGCMKKLLSDQWQMYNEGKMNKTAALL